MHVMLACATEIIKTCSRSCSRMQIDKGSRNLLFTLDFDELLAMVCRSPLENELAKQDLRKHKKININKIMIEIFFLSFYRASIVFTIRGWVRK